MKRTDTPPHQIGTKKMKRHEDDYAAEAAALGDGHAENYQDDYEGQYHAGFGTYAG